LWVLVAAMALVAVAASVFAKLYRYNVVDDAFISFQYAKNWWLGRGLVFNAGERVEGYTNFLWVALLTPTWAAARALGIDFTRAAIGLNALVSLADLALLYLVARRLLRGAWVAVSLVLLLCALDGSYLAYSMSGLENHLFVLCMLAAVLAWVGQTKKRWLWTGLALAATAMTRPDGVLVVGAFGLAYGLGRGGGGGEERAGGEQRGRGPEARPLAWALGTWAACYGVYFACRWAYYGLPLPNTFYLKVGNTLEGLDRGWVYLSSFAEDRYGLPVVALLALRWAKTDALVRWLLGWAAAHAAYVVYVGGDFYSGHRFLVVLLPVAYLLVGLVFLALVERVRGSREWQVLRSHPARAAAAVAVAAVAIGLGLTAFARRGLERGPYRNEILRWAKAVDNNVRYMKWLATVAPPGASMVVGDIGAAGFFADVRVVDYFGIIDPSIARRSVPGFGRGKPGHEKVADREALLARKPTFIKWGYVHGDLSQNGYFLFTEFPPSLEVEGLWWRDDLASGTFLRETAIHFDAAEMAGWEASGTAFRSVPTTQPVRGQRWVFWNEGSYLDSFTAELGDRATGRLLSPPIQLVGDKMVLRVGGGRDPERERVSLLVDGARAFDATGNDFETMGRRVWEIGRYRGKSARIEIVDEATEGWGHILVDEVVQWVAGSGR
jgi:hypothetical protein